MATKTPAAKKTTGTAVATKKPSAGMVSIQDAIRAQAALMNERTAPASGNNIKVTSDKTMKLPDGQTVTEIDLVIVDFMATQNFYPAGFDPKNIVPPDCFAIGTNPQKLVPSKNAPNKQSNDCPSCPMFQWGSDGNGKACKSGRKLAVLPPEADADTPMWLLNVSPTGIKNYDAFVQACARMGTIPVGVVVTVTCDPAATYQTLRFSDPRPNENIESHYERMGEAQTMCSSEPDVSSWKPVQVKGRAAVKTAARR